MKKQLKNFGGIFLLGATLSACISEQTEDLLEISQENRVEVNGKTLSFADFESYENAIQDPKEILSLDFRSIAKLTKAERASSTGRILSDEESSRGLDYFELGATFNVHLGGTHAISGYPDSFELRKIKKS